MRHTIKIFLLVLTLALTSCCEIPYFIQQEDIEYTSSHQGITLNYEAARFDNRCDIFQVLNIGSQTVLEKNNIVVLQDGKPLKFKLEHATPTKWKKIKHEVNLPGQSLIMVRAKANTTNGNSLVMIERNYPQAGDSIVTILRCREYDTWPAGFHDPNSVVGKMLPRVTSK